MKDALSHTDNTASRQVCRRVVQELIEKHAWALLPEDKLVELVLNSVPPDAAPAELDRLAKHYYTIALYKACRQNEDPERRERAYHELFRYLYRAAYNRCPELAEDATQRALTLVYEQIEHCRQPGTFLAFALWKLRHAFQQELETRNDDWHAAEIYRAAERGESAAQSHLGQKERLRVLIEAIQRLRDERKRNTILLKYLGGLNDEEISVRLRVTVGNVRVLRHRGLARLREDEQLRDYFDIPEIR